MPVADSNLNGTKIPDNQVQSEECKPYVSSKCTNESEVREENPQGFPTDKVGMDLNKEDMDSSYINSEGRDTTIDGSLQKVVLTNNSTPDKPVRDSEYANQLVGKWNEQNGTYSDPSESGSGRNNMPLDGDSGLLEHLNGFAFPDSAVISEDGLGAGEFGSVKCCSNKSFSDEIPELSRETANEHRSDADKCDDDFPSRKTPKSGDVCLYRCCSECIKALWSLTKKLLVHEWKLCSCHWTVEDVHNVVASLSVDLISAARRVFDSGVNNPIDGEVRLGNDGKFECPELITCNCNNPENEIVVLRDCSCHSVSHSPTTEEATSLTSEPRLELKFIFRDGVLVPMDPEKDESFHCKFETLCLCSLVEMIAITKQPSD